jgi:hypothetical protein
MKRPSNQAGFAAVELLLVLILFAILGFTGYYVVHARNNANKTLDTAANTAEPSISKTPSKVANDQTGYLVIKEWSVKLKLADPISDATYHLSSTKAWLSTAKLDKDSACFDATNARQTYAGVTQYKADETVDVLDTPKDGDNYMKASQAAEDNPQSYRQIGNYVYFYDQGNGQQCSAETTAQANAFETAFKTITAE